MKINRIDHIHYKTSDVDRDLPIVKKLLGIEPAMEADFSDSQGMKDVVFTFPIGFQLTQVGNPDGPVGKVYKDVPDGIFGFALNVPNADEAAAEMYEMGYELLYENDFGPVKERVFFVEPLNLIIEINEFPENLMDMQDEIISMVKGEN